MNDDAPHGYGTRCDRPRHPSIWTAAADLPERGHLVHEAEAAPYRLTRACMAANPSCAFVAAVAAGVVCATLSPEPRTRYVRILAIVVLMLSLLSAVTDREHPSWYFGGDRGLWPPRGPHGAGRGRQVVIESPAHSNQISIS
jgi:hypothetical protein